MSRIPETHEAARDLERQFRELAGAAVPAPGARGRGRVTRRLLFATAVAVLAIAAAAGAGGLFDSGHGNVAGPQSLPRGLARAPRDLALAQAHARDPLGQWEWGMRRYTSKSGATCVVPGRMVQGQLVIPDGTRLDALPPNTPGTCSRLNHESHAVIAQNIYGPTTGDRAVLFGFVDRTVTGLHLRLRDGQTRPVSIAPDGTYLAVFAPYAALHGVTLYVRRGTKVHAVLLHH